MNLEQAKLLCYNVKRGDDPDYHGIINESVGEHIDGCVSMAKALEMPEAIDLERVVAILELHDLPEIVGDHDETAVAKLNEMVALRADERELKKAKELFTDEQMALYLDFNKAGAWLKGKSDDQSFSAEAVVAQVIDKIQGNLKFHQSWSKWVMSPDYDVQFVMKAAAATFTRNQAIAFTRRLDDYEGTGAVKLFSQNLLREELKTVAAYWEPVEKRGIAIVW